MPGDTGATAYLLRGTSSASGDATNPDSGSRRARSTRTSAAYLSDARTTRASEAQQATATRPVLPSRSANSKPGRSHSHTRSPAGVGFAHRTSGNVPGRVEPGVRTNPAKHSRSRCRTTTHHDQAARNRRTGPTTAQVPNVVSTVAAASHG